MRIESELSSAAKKRLLKVVHKIYCQHQAEIDKLKLSANDYGNPHFIWNALLLSFSTMGNSRGAKLMEDPAIRATVEFDAISRLTPSERKAALRNALYAAKVRMPDIKTAWLIRNYERIVVAGGPESVKRMLEAQPGRAGKIRFLKSFQGIGDKYSRNLLMDVYHPDFRHSIAYDDRLKQVSNALGLDFGGNYEAAEGFFLGVAESAGLNGWELDRLLYQYKDHVIDALGRNASAPPLALPVCDKW